MKRVILSTRSDSYAAVLRAIRDELISQGKEAVINLPHHCVDVLVDGEVREQHYPDMTGTDKATRGKYVYVGEGQGTHILTRVEYERKKYSKDNHKVKYVSYTDRYNQSK